MFLDRGIILDPQRTCCFLGERYPTMHGEPPIAHSNPPSASGKAHHPGSVMIPVMITFFVCRKSWPNVETSISYSDIAVLCGLGWHRILGGNITVRSNTFFEIPWAKLWIQEKNHHQFSNEIHLRMILNPYIGTRIKLLWPWHRCPMNWMMKSTQVHPAVGFPNLYTKRNIVSSTRLVTRS